MYNLTNKQKELLVWLVKNIKRGDLEESFSVMFAQGGIYAIAPSKGISKYAPKGITEGTFRALAKEDMLDCHSINKGVSCTIQGKAFVAVETNFAELIPSTSTAVDPEQLAISNLIHKHFNKDEIKILCFKVGVNFDDLGTENLELASHELTARMIRNGRKKDLIDCIVEERPNLASFFNT